MKVQTYVISTFCIIHHGARQFVEDICRQPLLYNFFFPTCRHFAFVPRKELVLILVNNHNAFAKNVVKSFQSSKFLLSSAKVAYFPLKRCRLLFGDLRTGGTGWLVVTYVTSAFISISGSLALWSELYLEIYLQNPPRENGNMGWQQQYLIAGRSKNLARKSVPD